MLTLIMQLILYVSLAMIEIINLSCLFQTKYHKKPKFLMYSTLTNVIVLTILIGLNITNPYNLLLIPIMILNLIIAIKQKINLKKDDQNE